MLTLQRFKGTIITMVVVLLISVLGVCVARATPPKSGSNEYVAWYVYVYDLRLLTSSEQTNSSHYYKVRRRGSKGISGTWEFSHKVREGHEIGKGGVVDGTDVSRTGPINLSKTKKKKSQQERDHRKADYSDMSPGDYYIEAYTSVSILVPGESTVYEKVEDTHTFTIREGE